MSELRLGNSESVIESVKLFCGFSYFIKYTSRISFVFLQLIENIIVLGVQIIDYLLNDFKLMT